MERFDRLGPTDCELVPEGLWRDECVFLYAERAAAAGDLPTAIAACETTRFGRECSYHLLRAAARAVVDAPPAEAALRIAPYQGLDDARDAPRLFWKAWFREQGAVDRPIDPTACPDEACRAAAREVLLTRLGAWFSAQGPGACDQPAPTGTDGARRVWVDGPTTRAWVDTWLRTNCARLRDPRAGPPRVTPPPP